MEQNRNAKKQEKYYLIYYNKKSVNQTTVRSNFYAERVLQKYKDNIPERAVVHAGQFFHCIRDGGIHAAVQPVFERTAI